MFADDLDEELTLKLLGNGRRWRSDGSTSHRWSSRGWRKRSSGGRDLKIREKFESPSSNNRQIFLNPMEPPVQQEEELRQRM
ncbi:hypothetical protein HYC85_007647 [Camellia sinensis]|uniref:Uncharacterized protein n=1 Tax=Camellia sinensis TaxID=4442 RepID=A0A7J7HRE8_CAMSI|nr:hypothetical protein HYC85_007647 [Camellia sinensis]